METQCNSKHIGICATMLLLGIAVGMFADPYFPASLSNSQKGYQAGFTAARTLAESSSAGSFFKTTSDVRSLIGSITSIGDNRIAMHLPAVNPFGDQSLSDRVVLLSSDTKIIKILPPPTPSAKTTAQVPSEETVSISDLKVGDSISVLAGENINTSKQFAASRILLLPMPSKP